MTLTMNHRRATDSMRRMKDRGEPIFFPAVAERHGIQTAEARLLYTKFVAPYTAGR